VPEWLCVLNPWIAYSKAAAHGALGNRHLAWRYYKLLTRLYPFNFLRERLACFWGLSQPKLVSILLTHRGASPAHLAAFEGSWHSRGGNGQPRGLVNPLVETIEHLSALPVLAQQTRVATINQILRGHECSRVSIDALSAFGIRYNLPERNRHTLDEQPLVSVLVTVFNCGSYCRSAIESLLAQTHSNLQILVSNDASTDDTQTQLSSLTSADSRVTVFNLPENIGTYAAKSLLLKFAIGDFVVCHDADDLADPCFVERSLSGLLQDKRRVASVSSWFRVDEELRVFPGAVRRFWPLLSVNHSSLFLRTRHLRDLGAWDVPRVAADVELYERLRSLYGANAIGLINAALTIGSIRSGSLMNHKGMGAMQAKAFRRRVAYRESFIRWHDDCKRRGVRPVMPSPFSAIRPYAVPRKLRVSHQAIARCYESMLATSPVKPVERV
jgi:glycosyltransferase involved in cell wall biosynthesis